MNVPPKTQINPSFCPIFEMTATEIAPYSPISMGLAATIGPLWPSAWMTTRSATESSDWSTSMRAGIHTKGPGAAFFIFERNGVIVCHRHTEIWRAAIVVKCKVDFLAGF